MSLVVRGFREEDDPPFIKEWDDYNPNQYTKVSVINSTS